MISVTETQRQARRKLFAIAGSDAPGLFSPPEAQAITALLFDLAREVSRTRRRLAPLVARLEQAVKREAQLSAQADKLVAQVVAEEQHRAELLREVMMWRKRFEAAEW